ncbi:hypothetical protein QBC43DRAFT_333495 [Cladorrhinum sp. PSN259]|nr:hypothetical protein QBC43DRAFT_333495 [Cladorrhinum sp. PSN259]
MQELDSINNRCEYCEEVVVSDDEIQRHIENDHPLRDGQEHTESTSGNAQVVYVPPPEFYQCGQCEKTFRYKRDLKIHYKMGHQGVPRPFRCEKCGLPFMSSESCWRHAHELHKTLRCEFCNCPFTTDGGYRRHMKNRKSMHRCPGPRGTGRQSLSGCNTQQSQGAQQSVSALVGTSASSAGSSSTSTEQLKPRSEPSNLFISHSASTPLGYQASSSPINHAVSISQTTGDAALPQPETQQQEAGSNGESNREKSSYWDVVMSG